MIQMTDLEIRPQRRNIGEHTRKRLLDTALMLIWQQSIGTVSVDDICAQACVQKGSFYHFFKSKSELIAAAMEESWIEKKKILEEVFSKKHPPLTRFKKVEAAIKKNQREYQKILGRVCGCPFASVGSESSGSDQVVWNVANKLSHAIRQFYIEAIKDGIQLKQIPKCVPAKAADDIYTFILGIMTQARIENSMKPFSRIEAGILKLLGL